MNLRVHEDMMINTRTSKQKGHQRQESWI